MDYKEKINKLADFIDSSKKIVFFTGADVSTESGIPDFRSSNGIYSKKFKGLSSSEIVSHDFLFSYPELFYEFYFKYLVYKDAKPNYAHVFFNELVGKKIFIITQNIDNLHQLGGSKRVLELHGSVENNYCIYCNKYYSLNEILEFQEKVPTCKKCNGMIRPDVTLFGEQLNQEVVSNAIEALEQADMLIVAGTSLEVYPAAMYVHYYKKDKFVLINKDSTKFDKFANIVFNCSVVDVFKDVKAKLQEKDKYEKN
ncbi:NAD-dependent protein deacylase [Malacoplasma muris]|uniref:NAD-dependent protein deacylase n=1 Tax=Malacoplasma muris TaxID=2119 RepID=UPI00398EA22D